jgi:phytoene dehydrogenase-like protein
MDAEVVIVGAGLSGLAAGIRLAHFGRRVVIVEKHSLWGGLNSFYKKGGHLFDVGLHALTNYVPPGRRGPRGPLQRLSRQLRIPLEEWDLVPQTRSSIRFDDATIVFDNDVETLRSEVGRGWPKEVDGFDRLVAACAEYPDPTVARPFVSARARLADYLRDPLLREMILCPLFYYGAADVDDLDWGDFVVLFSSIFLEGLGRPRRGMRPFLRRLVDRFREAGGEMIRNCAVVGFELDGDRVTGVRLASGSTLRPEAVLSSAGARETLRLAGRATGGIRPGPLSFLETVWVFDRPPWGPDDFSDCVTFYNRGPALRWRPPEAGDIDLASGVLCCPNNYAGAEAPAETHLRVTHLASPGRFLEAAESDYGDRKAEAVAASAAAVESLVGPFRAQATYCDAFTPRTVRHYTGHEQGAIYGSPDKQRSGDIGLENVFLIGTDQGLVGIVGAMTSGLAIANARLAS